MSQVPRDRLLLADWQASLGKAGADPIHGRCRIEHGGTHLLAREARIVLDEKAQCARGILHAAGVNIRWYQLTICPPCVRVGGQRLLQPLDGLLISILQETRGSETGEAVEVDWVEGAQPNGLLEALYAFGRPIKISVQPPKPVPTPSTVRIELDRTLQQLVPFVELP